VPPRRGARPRAPARDGRRRRATGVDGALRFGGAGLAVAAKGGLGLVAAAFALAFVAARRDPALRARDLARAPAVALGAAQLVAALRAGRAARVLHALCIAIPGVLGIAGAAIVLAATRLGVPASIRIALAGASVLATSGLAVWLARRGPRERALLASALSLGVALVAADTGVRPVFDASPVPALDARLRGLPDPAAGGRGVATLGAPVSLSAQLRLASGGRLDPVSIPAGAEVARLSGYGAVVTGPEEAARLAAAGWRTERVGFGFGRWRARDVRALLGSPDPGAELEARRVWSWVAPPPAQNFHLPPGPDLR
jgi:hypothetical protein